MSTRQPPFEHCSSCPYLIYMMDACPVNPLISAYNEQGIAAFGDFERLYELLMVILSLGPWLFSIYLMIQLAVKRNRKVMIRCGTHLLAHITCDVVKVIYFREERPDGSCSLKYGLPSCHSIFAGLYTSWILIDIIAFGTKVAKRHIFAVLFMSFVPYSRIYLIYHTLKQCLYGWSIGTVFAILGSLLHLAVQKKKQKAN